MNGPAGTDTALRQAVRDVVAELLSTRLDAAQEDLALADIEPDRYDSLGVLDCVGAVEQRFGVSVDLVDDDLRATFRSIASIAALVDRKLCDAAVLG
jgi:acyl carrier protein